MSTNKRITDLTDYTSVLPYASEMFGVYQPMIGWRSKRVLQRMKDGIILDNNSKYKSILSKYNGVADIEFNQDNFFESASLDIGIQNKFSLKPQHESVLLRNISQRIQDSGVVPSNQEWLAIINEDSLKNMLNTEVLEFYKDYYRNTWSVKQSEIENNRLIQALKTESAIAGALLGYVKNNLFDKLELLFIDIKKDDEIENIFELMKQTFDDPYLTFDPKKDIEDVSLSPIGIVHLYRQYFFELDTFLGTPTSHVWLSPGSSVELIEISSKKTITEKTFETSLESTSKTEQSTTDQDDISKAVKQDNKNDMKLGFSATVNQSWATGNASATGSLNMDKTQQLATEKVNKHMRQQSSKLSTEIRQNFKSTFKTITEVTDTSSKRYLLNNTTSDLINYELRRKMRQVGVQIQDIGSYLCWETFVDEPGKQLGLPNLVHIAQPADLILVPNPKEIPKPDEFITIGFSGEMVWYTPDNKVLHNEDHPDVLGRFVPFNTLEITGIPDGYEVVIPPDPQDLAKPNPFIEIQKSTIAADGDSSWNFANNLIALGMITSDKKYVKVGIITPQKPGYFTWDKRLSFKVSGSIACKLIKSKSDEIDKANAALRSAKEVADNENHRKQEEAYRKTAKERIALASKIKKRKFEDLREEERTIVYRNLIESLMSDNKPPNLQTYNAYRNLPETPSGYETRHVLSELINSIFDVDKMLYFVAPEWWKPRKISKLSIGSSTIQNSINDSLVNWPDQQTRLDNYYITDDSEPAPLGSSLGWLLQLDGDDLRNAFLNAPWVKAVIPIRPGKEQAAINWLQNVNVEGSNGLDAAYAAPEQELDQIRAILLKNNPSDPVRTHPQVTINDAIRKLCLDVSEKEEASKVVGKYPKEEINDDNKVLATPIDKVYEHGFYPLKGGFKAKVEENFDIVSQWIEVLPTDQIVPVEVKYDPKTGRQI
jgi:hypothetical protein